MALPVNRPLNDFPIYARTTSIGASPAACATIAPVKGLLERVATFFEGAATGTVTTTIAINGTSAATVTATAGTATGSMQEISTPVAVNESDVVTFTPAGGTGATIAGHYYGIIRGG
jgi:hypothetical protein